MQKKIKQKKKNEFKWQKNRKGIWCIAFLLVGAMAFQMTSHAEEAAQIKSKGRIHYTDKSGAEVVFDTGDLEMLFQSAAKGKNGMLQALGGVGTKFEQTEEGWKYSRNPEKANREYYLQSANQLQEISFSLLNEALSDSQKLPEEYTDSYSLATSDNLTLGRAAWADGSLLLGNNHDVTESYARGWLEGAGYSTMTPLKDEKGNVIGYIFE